MSKRARFRVRRKDARLLFPGVQLQSVASSLYTVGSKSEESELRSLHKGRGSQGGKLTHRSDTVLRGGLQLTVACWRDPSFPMKSPALSKTRTFPEKEFLDQSFSINGEYLHTLISRNCHS